TGEYLCHPARETKSSPLMKSVFFIVTTVASDVRSSAGSIRKPDKASSTEWIQLRLELLAVSFAIEVCDFALLDNHIHLILRTRPDIVVQWEDREVALRWWHICPTRRDEKGNAAEPLPCELKLRLDD